MGGEGGQREKAEENKAAQSNGKIVLPFSAEMSVGVRSGMKTSEGGEDARLRCRS